MFGEIRTMTNEQGEPWFVGKDVAEALGYSNPQKALRDHVDTENRTVNESFTVNGTPPVLINESGLYYASYNREGNPDGIDLRSVTIVKIRKLRGKQKNKNKKTKRGYLSR